MNLSKSTSQWFVKVRDGLFIHFDLFSTFQRRNREMNRNQIDIAEFSRSAHQFSSYASDGEGSAGRKPDVEELLQAPVHRLIDNGIDSIRSIRVKSRAAI